MKKILYISFFCLLQTLVQAQDQDKEIKFDGLNAPSSPAFNLLGISPSSIDRPTDITSFAVSVQNASSDFSSLPNSYAMEFLPFTLFSVNSMTTKELGETNFKDVFKQTFLISLGVTNELENEDDPSIPSLTKLGVGLKFSLIRPSFDSITKSNLDVLYASQKKLILNVSDVEFEDELLDVYKGLKKELNEENKKLEKELTKLNITDDEKKEINKKLKEITEKLLELSLKGQNRKKELFKDYKEDLKTEIGEKSKALVFNRSGLFLDFACGSVINFKDETFNRSQISRAGAWLTGGYTFKSSFEILGITRYLYQPDKLLADDSGLLDTKNVSSVDGGLRLIYRTLKKEQLSLSAESIYRSVLDTSILEPSWRLVCNASYDLGSNKVVTFSFGKDFDNTIIKGDNLIASLNFIIGFGNSIKNDNDTN